MSRRMTMREQLLASEADAQAERIRLKERIRELKAERDGFIAECARLAQERDRLREAIERHRDSYGDQLTEYDAELYQVLAGEGE